MTEVAGLSHEQIQWLTVSREIETLLLGGFAGNITLHCAGDGTVHKVNFDEVWKPGEKRRQLERRTAGPRDGEDRQPKG